MADTANTKRAIVGFAPEQAAEIRLPLKVSIDAGNVGGPSAGLAFALEVMEELGHNVDRGYKVAATGQIELDGAVTPIGGVKQKTFGVAGGESGRLSRAGWGKRAGGAALREWPAHHRCEEFSPGVARAGNVAPKGVENGTFPARSETAGNSSVFVAGNACSPAIAPYDRPASTASYVPDTQGRNEQTN